MMKMYHSIILSKSIYIEVPSLQAICPVLPLKGRLNRLKVIDFAFFRVFDITCYFAAVNENRNTHIHNFLSIK